MSRTVKEQFLTAHIHTSVGMTSFKMGVKANMKPMCSGQSSALCMCVLLTAPTLECLITKAPQPPTVVSVLGFLAESQLLPVTLKKLQYKKSQCRQGRGGIARTSEVLSQTCSETGQGIVLGLPIAPSQALG